jgi:Tol biopolymer transport system component
MTSRLPARGLAAGTTALALAATMSPALAAALAEPVGTNVRVALHATTGEQAPTKSYANGSAPVATAGGRYVVFSTDSPLVTEDTNGLSDVYLRDTLENRTVLISQSYAGRIGNGDSFEPTISANGMTIAFTTSATNLVTGAKDDNGRVLDVVAVQVQDGVGGIAGIVSTRNDGTQASRNSFFPVVSGDGLVVAFQTFGRLGPKDADRREDVYVHSTKSGRTTQASLNARDRDVAASVLVGDIDRWGRYVTFGNDHDIWVRDVGTGNTRRVWHEANDPAQPFPAGSAGRPVISGDGRFVAFTTMSTTIVAGERGHWSDVFRVNVATGRARRVTVDAQGGQPDDHSFIPSLSFSGRYVGFSSFAGDLVPGDAPGSDAFVHDMRTRTTYLASAGLDGPANGESGRTAVAISDDGRTLVYETYATNLVEGDTVDMAEVVAWRR